MRIVSLLPSATEMICEIGLGSSLCGVSHECDHPAEFTNRLPRVTAALIPQNATSDEIDRIVRERAQAQPAIYSLNQELIAKLRPDTIVTQTLCDVCAVSQEDVIAASKHLKQIPQIINLAPLSLSDVLDQMRWLGKLLGNETQSNDAVVSLQARIDAVNQRGLTMSRRVSVVLLEWITPLFSAGHWNPELVRLAGGEAPIGCERSKSRRIDWQEILDADPEVMVIACCGFEVERSMLDVPKLMANPGFEALRCVRNGRVYVVDGSAYFNRPGPRLVESLELLAHIIDPQTHPHPLNPKPYIQL